MSLTSQFFKPLSLLSLLLILSILSCEKHVGKNITDIAEPIVSPGWISFKPEAKINPKTLFKDYAEMFHLPKGNEMTIQSEETDSFGITHFRYQQFFQKVEVENAEFLVHAKNNVAVTANGNLAFDFQPETIAPQLTEAQAWDIVRQRIPSERYLREDSYFADFMGTDSIAAPTDYRPTGILLFAEDPNSTAAERKLVWVFKVYALPLDKSRQIYINAADGTVLKEMTLIPSCQAGSGPVNFRGNQNFNTQQNGDRFNLTDDCDGNLLKAQLVDAANKVVSISDDDNNWAGNNPSVVTSYWGLRTSYDYFRLIHNRKSYDGANGNMTIVNDPNMRDGGHNATGGGGGIRIGLAVAGNDNDDYNTLDIVGHEFTHSLIEKTAKLKYDSTQECNALNESFCDIFGQMVEQWLEGSAQKDWIIGDDKGCTGDYVCRDLQNPKSRKQPDTYKGSWYQTPAVDPHTNGCVQNRWFYLLCDGGTGKNDLLAEYNVTGIGMSKARRIAYYTLTNYLTANSDYKDARNGSIYAAETIFGVNSKEVGEVTKAWCAVGLCPYTVPKKADRFDLPGGNPNPASPDNNNTVGGATPLGTGGLPWTAGTHPTLSIDKLSIYPFNDVDYFKISFPDLVAPGGRCFSSGFGFNFGTPVNARILVNGAVKANHVNAAYFSISDADAKAGDFVLEVKPAFPGQILEYNLEIGSYLHFNSMCYQTNPPDKWEQIRQCPMCNLKILGGVDRIVLEPLYRQTDRVPIQDNYFYWKGDGGFEIPFRLLNGNNLQVELVNEAGETVALERNAGANGMLMHGLQLREGVYSLRFSGYGNGTEVEVVTPQR